MRKTHGFDPMVPAEMELISVDVSVLIFIKYGEHLLQLIVGNDVDMTLVISKESATDESKFSQRQEVVTRK